MMAIIEIFRCIFRMFLTKVLLPTFFWCKAVHEKVKQQIKDVDAAESKEVPLFWCGMAEVNRQKSALICY